MTPTPDATPNRPIDPVWYKIGAVALLVIAAFLFFFLASARLRHRAYDEAPPAGTEPAPGQVIAH
jgi:hypothetical protein